LYFLIRGSIEIKITACPTSEFQTKLKKVVNECGFQNVVRWLDAAEKKDDDRMQMLSVGSKDDGVSPFN